MTQNRIIAPVFLLLATLLLASPCLYAQQTIKGRVVDVAQGNGLGNCNVFISSTSTGTVTDKNGYFVLYQVPNGKYDLVISSVGFETQVYPFSSGQLPLELNVQLRRRVKELENIVLEPFEEGNFEKWKGVFIPEFIGRNENAADCKIRNPEIIQFRYYRTSQRLVAFADEPLLIENDALGYSISYQLEDFELNMNKNTTYFMGYPLFKDMETDRPKKKERWKKNREAAYQGSVMHFMRCLYNNTLVQEGFEVKRMYNVLNTEKARIKKFYDPQISLVVVSLPTGSSSTHNFTNEPKGLPADSLKYYRTVIVQFDSIIKYSPYLLTADSLIVSAEGEYKVAYFGGSLYVLKKKPAGGRSLHSQWSAIHLPSDKEIIIGRNGNYFNSRDVIGTGNWAINERVSNLLPWDY